MSFLSPHQKPLEAVSKNLISFCMLKWYKGHYCLVNVLVRLTSQSIDSLKSVLRTLDDVTWTHPSLGFH